MRTGTTVHPRFLKTSQSVYRRISFSQQITVIFVGLTQNALRVANRVLLPLFTCQMYSRVSLRSSNCRVQNICHLPKIDSSHEILGRAADGFIGQLDTGRS
jgi:hypothetical protein